MPDTLAAQILLYLYDQHERSARATAFYMELWLETEAFHAGDDSILDAALKTLMDRGWAIENLARYQITAAGIKHAVKVLESQAEPPKERRKARQQGAGMAIAGLFIGLLALIWMLSVFLPGEGYHLQKGAASATAVPTKVEIRPSPMPVVEEIGVGREVAVLEPTILCHTPGYASQPSGQDGCRLSAGDRARIVGGPVRRDGAIWWGVQMRSGACNLKPGWIAERNEGGGPVLRGSSGQREP